MLHNKTVRIPRGIVAVRADANEAPNIKALVENLNKAFADFRAEHDKQLEEVKKGTTDALQALKVDKINADIARLQTSVDEANIALTARGNAGTDADLKDPEYSHAFDAYTRKGSVQASLSSGSDPDGGYTAPTEWDRTITDKLKLVSPMRRICRVQTVSVGAFSKLFNKRGTASGWVGETDARPATAGSQLGSLTFAACELYANPNATQQLLDDSLVNIADWIGTEVQTEFAYQEGKAFVSGSATTQPKGVLTYVTGGTNAATHPFGAVGTVNSGGAATITADGVLNLVYALPAAFVGNATIICNRKTLGALRLLKDSQNRYLWQPSYAAGQPSTLAGFPVVEVNDMPDVAASALSVAFGDFQQAYLIVDRAGIRVLRDPFTNKPYVAFYTTKRVGGGVLNPEAVKVMTVAA